MLLLTLECSYLPLLVLAYPCLFLLTLDCSYSPLEFSCSLFFFLHSSFFHLFAVLVFILSFFFPSSFLVLSLFIRRPSLDLPSSFFS